MKPKIVFHSARKTLEEAEGLKIFGRTTRGEFLDALVAFERGEARVLNVSINQCTGWRTKLRADEVDIEFVGCDGDLYAEEREQAKYRTAPVFLREDATK